MWEGGMATRKNGKGSVRQTKIGFLGATTPTIWSAYVFALDSRLRELGWIDGANAVIDYQWAEGQPKKFKSLANYFVNNGVDIIITSGTGAALAAKEATEDEGIPVVFAAAGDPTKAGLVKSFAQPGGNVTGLSNEQAHLAGERVKRLLRAFPDMERLGIVGNGASANVQPDIDAVVAACGRKIETVPCDIRKSGQITSAIQGLKGKVDALYVCTDLLLTTHEVAVNVAAATVQLPTMHAFREYVEAGGLMSYGPDIPSMFERAAELADNILRGADPATIAVETPDTAEFVVNTSTASAIGVTLPKGLGAKPVH
jgi:putative ABC transport system substrate-binding protein